METLVNDNQEFDTYALVMKCLVDTDGKIEIEAKHDKSIIPTEQMDRVLRQYDFFLSQICSKLDVRLSDIFSVRPGDLEEIKGWNGSLPAPIETTVHQVIAQRTRERPQAQAVCAWDGNYTYQELEDVTNKLAAHLQRLGVGVETKVGLLFDKSKWNVVSMLSVLKAGGTYTQLSPEYPAARIQSILDNSEAAILLCAPQHRILLDSIATRTLAVDQESVNSIPIPNLPVVSRVSSRNSAFIVFTSGSTGKPKGAIVEHRGICTMQVSLMFSEQNFLKKNVPGV